ncbi:hypothetical protein ML462_13950 [Gramella lutea]|uniref:Uncharacterized protein n=1 Tax=Christiangramia lutea TaxID=1607951 RepID=A0A9X2AA33_9FLAO|nr:hypothetical protein [Christiangramia lutea]MCH4824274.1 hypothetical protein [Christiangramia lutea]
MKATKEQKQAIYRLCGYQKDTKEEYVQWVTGDVNKTSTNDLSFEQANKIIKQAGGTPYKNKTDNWAFFNKDNGKHKYILSLCRQLDWTTPDERFGKVVDLNRLSEWLKSDKSPVKKPLKKMNARECSKIITALEGMIDTKFK